MVMRDCLSEWLIWSSLFLFFKELQTLRPCLRLVRGVYSFSGFWMNHAILDDSRFLDVHVYWHSVKDIPTSRPMLLLSAKCSILQTSSLFLSTAILSALPIIILGKYCTSQYLEN